MSLDRLARKRLELQLRCAQQRLELEQTALGIEQQLGDVDHAIDNVRRVVTSPWVLGAGALAALWLGPRRVVKAISWAGRALFAATAYKKLILR